MVILLVSYVVFPKNIIFGNINVFQNIDWEFTEMNT